MFSKGYSTGFNGTFLFSNIGIGKYLVCFSLHVHSGVITQFLVHSISVYSAICNDAECLRSRWFTAHTMHISSELVPLCTHTQPM